MGIRTEWFFMITFTIGLSGLSSSGCVTGPSPNELKQAEIQYDLGVNELAASRLKEALKNFLEAVRLYPGFPQAQNGLGLVYYLLGENDKALVCFNKALELKPEYSEVRSNVGRVYISQGKYRQAIPVLRKALEDVFLPERYLTESNLGWALFQIGEEQEGFKFVKNALAQNDKYCVGFEYLGLMHQAKKNYEDAIAELKQLVELCPDYMFGYQHLGKVYLMVGELEGGCAALQTCVQKSRMTDVGQECDRLYRLSCADKNIPTTRP